MKEQPAIHTVELVGFLFRFGKDDFDALKEIVGDDSFVKDIENAVHHYIFELPAAGGLPRAAEIVQAMRRVAAAAKKLDDAIRGLPNGVYWPYYDQFAVREAAVSLVRDSDSALQHAVDELQPKPGAPKKQAQDRLAIRIRETLEKAGCRVTTTAGGDWATVFDLCVQATGLELKDPTSVLKKVRREGK